METMTIEERCEADRIRMRVDYQGLQTDPDGWVHHKYRCFLRFEGRQMSATMETGTGWKTAPALADVMASLVREAQDCLACDGYEDWAAMYEDDPEGWVTRGEWARVARRTDRLLRLLGEQADTYLDPELTDTTR